MGAPWWLLGGCFLVGVVGCVRWGPPLGLLVLPGGFLVGLGSPVGCGLQLGRGGGSSSGVPGLGALVALDGEFPPLTFMFLWAIVGATLRVFPEVVLF